MIFLCTGMMLEIKGFAPLRVGGCTLASCALVPCQGMPQSVQESTLFYDKFVAGLLVSDENRKHLNQVSPLLHTTIVCADSIMDGRI